MGKKDFRLAVRPPEYLPRLSYMALMLHVDVFVLADTYQYSRQSFQNRTRIRKPAGGQWLTLPVASGQSGSRIVDVQMDHRRDWAGGHRRTLYYNHRSTAFYEYVKDQMESFLDNRVTALVDVVMPSIRFLIELTGLSTNLVRASELEGAPETLPNILDRYPGAELWSLEDTMAKDAGQYGNVRPFSVEFKPYRQNFTGFVADLSTLDLFMNYGPESITIIKDMRKML